MWIDLLIQKVHRLAGWLPQHFIPRSLGVVVLGITTVWLVKYHRGWMPSAFRFLWSRIQKHRDLVLASAFGCALFAFRILWTGRLQFGFLPWNLFLAWIPLCLGEALALPWIRNHRWAFFALGTTWLLFLPNAPYLVTDVIHWKPRWDAPAWMDLLILIHFATLGIFLGLKSLLLVQRIVAEHWGNLTARRATVAFLLLTSFGIYLGRFQRWNSWDVLTQPGDLIRDVAFRMAMPWQHPRMCGFTLLCFLFLLLFLRLVEDLARETRQPVSRMPSDP